MNFYNDKFKIIRKQRDLTIEKLTSLMRISQRTLEIFMGKNNYTLYGKNETSNISDF